MVRHARVRFAMRFAAFLAVAVASGALVATQPAAAVAPTPVPYPVGTLFATTTFGVYQIDAAGNRSYVLGLSNAGGVAVDGSGDVFASDGPSGKVFKVAPSGATTVIAVSTNPGPLATTPLGDVYFVNEGQGAVTEVAASGGSRQVAVPISYPSGVAVDAYGNVVVGGGTQVVRVTVAGAVSTVGNGLKNVQGVAVDPAGNVFAMDSAAGELLKFAPDGTATVLASGLRNASGLALDAVGNLYTTLAGALRSVPAGGGPVGTVTAPIGAKSSVAVFAPPPTFRGSPVAPAGTVGVAYPGVQFQVDVPAGEPSATISVVSGSLPPGLSIDPRSGQIDGIPTKAGSYAFQLQAANGATASVTSPVLVTIGMGSQTIVFTSSPPTHAKAGDTYQVVASAGGSGNAVIFSRDTVSTPGSCTVSSTGLVTFGVSGVCVVDADQAGNADYAAAPRATQSIRVPGPGFVAAFGPSRSGDTTVPASVGTNPSGVGAIAAGGDSSFAVADGRVVGWGDNSLGQTTIPAGAGANVTQVAATSGGALALKNDNTLLDWGWLTPKIPAGLSGPLAPHIDAITGENAYYLALTGGAVTEFGGTDGFGISAVPAAAKSAVIAIDSGTGHALALKYDGSVIAWGANNTGQATVPAAAQSFVAAIAAGGNHSLALKTDHTVVAWGDSALGLSSVPAAAQGKTVAIAAGTYFDAALLADGTILTWGTPDTTATIPPPTDGTITTTLAAGNRHLLTIRR
jgi:Putative Ig domain/Regulator of chromosome condensation (RCC1) repeat